MAPSLSEQRFCLRWNNHKSHLLSEFTELLEHETFTDVTLVVEDGPSYMKCHKMILAACSTYFESLFIDLPSNEQHPFIVLKDVKYSEMKAILEYMYQGEVNIAENQLSELLKVADLLKVKGLVEEKPREISKSPPPAITTSSEIPQEDNFYQKDSSTPSIYYPKYGKLGKIKRKYPTSHLPLPLLDDFPSQSASSSFHESDNHNFDKRTENIKETPILKNVLEQGYPDNSIIQNDNQRIQRSSSNGSANDDRRSSLDAGQSSYPIDVSMEDDDTEFSPIRQQNKKKKDTKRYKKYTQQDMNLAIATVVERKLSALDSAKLYQVPPRTLYDKLRKLGITTQRNRRRRSSGVHFPDDINYRNEQSGDHDDIQIDNRENSSLDEELQHDEQSDNDYVQDLSVNRTNVIVHHQIKEEKSDDSQK